MRSDARTLPLWNRAGFCNSQICFLVCAVRSSTKFSSGSEPRLSVSGRFRDSPGWRRMDAFLLIKSQGKEHAQLVHFKHPVLQDHLVPTASILILLRSKCVISRTLDVTRYTLIQCLTPPWPRWQVWNTDVRPLILTPCLLTIVPGTWNPHTAFGTSFMFCKSGSWQLPGKCRCLFTAGKYNINFTHTSSNSTKVPSFSYAKSTHARPCTRVFLHRTSRSCVITERNKEATFQRKKTSEAWWEGNSGAISHALDRGAKQYSVGPGSLIQSLLALLFLSSHPLQRRSRA